MTDPVLIGPLVRIVRAAILESNVDNEKIDGVIRRHMIVDPEDLSIITGRCAIGGCWKTPHQDARCFWHYHGTTPPEECQKHDFKHGACRRCHIPRGDLDPIEVEVARKKLSRLEKYPVL